MNVRTDVRNGSVILVLGRKAQAFDVNPSIASQEELVCRTQS